MKKGGREGGECKEGYRSLRESGGSRAFAISGQKDGDTKLYRWTESSTAAKQVERT